MIFTLGSLALAIIECFFDTSNSSTLVGSISVRYSSTSTSHHFSRPDFRSTHAFSGCLSRSLNILFHDGVDTGLFLPTNPQGVLPGCGTFF